MPHESPFILDYWLSLPERHSEVKKVQIKQFCTEWSRAALGAISRDGYSGIFDYYSAYSNFREDSRRWGGLDCWRHTWLGAVKNGNPWIADGLAGFMLKDPTLQLGYYGFLEEAPEGIRWLYELGQIGNSRIR